MLPQLRWCAPQGKTEVHDARQPSDDLRLPTVIRRRKGRLDLEAEAEVLAPLPLPVSLPLTRPLRSAFGWA